MKIRIVPVERTLEQMETVVQALYDDQWEYVGLVAEGWSLFTRREIVFPEWVGTITSQKAYSVSEVIKTP